MCAGRLHVRKCCTVDMLRQDRSPANRKIDVNFNYIEVAERLRQGLEVAFIFEYLYTAII